MHLARLMPPNSIDAIVTDPPYGLSFMGKRWDKGVPGVLFWKEFLRIAKPGSHLLAFGGTRTYHRLVCAIEDAGWEVRDTIAWVHGMGFPKSLNVSKAIDKKKRATRKKIGSQTYGGRAAQSCKEKGGSYTTRAPSSSGMTKEIDITAPSTPQAIQYDGYGTALKPAFEPILVARKPLDKDVVTTVLKHGTGAINIDGCRVDLNNEFTKEHLKSMRHRQSKTSRNVPLATKGLIGTDIATYNSKGRWPANLIHDGSDEVNKLFPKNLTTGNMNVVTNNTLMTNRGPRVGKPFHHKRTGDSGSAARFFYCAKPSMKEKDRYLNGMENKHPTVKPQKLMRYLCRLVTTPNALVLDPFMGSGTTGIAAMIEGLRFIGFDNDEQSYEMAKKRLERVNQLMKE